MCGTCNQASEKEAVELGEVVFGVFEKMGPKNQFLK